ncbi:Protein MRPL-18 [Aphelenchoides avenae]|nr:Protein MRPL-18 [Aphelenchus avenae]
MEMLRLQRRPTGWSFEKNRDLKNFTYKAVFGPSKAHIDAHIVHHENGIVLSASTREPEIHIQLQSTADRHAAYNIGRVLADRCQQSGISYCIAGAVKEEVERSQRKSAFFKALEDGGIKLQEPESIPHSHMNDPNLTWERFPMQHTREDKLDEIDLKMKY